MNPDFCIIFFLKTITQRIVRLLEKQGLIIQDEGVEDKSLDLTPDEPIDHIHASSITYRIALGKYKGQKALTLGSLPNSKPQKEKEKPFLAKYSGFSLHAGVSCKSYERKKLEHICRYISRPSLSEERLYDFEKCFLFNQHHFVIISIHFRLQIYYLILPHSAKKALYFSYT